MVEPLASVCILFICHSSTGVTEDFVVLVSTRREQALPASYFLCSHRSHNYLYCDTLILAKQPSPLRVTTSQTESSRVEKMSDGTNDEFFECFSFFSLFWVGVHPDISGIPRSLEVAASRAVVTTMASWAVVTP